jgi:hypothetical protein
MTTLLEFIARIAPFIYGLAAIGAFFALRRALQGRNALRIAVFGLEREAAREKLRGGFSTLLILGLVAGAVYIIANIVVPNMSGLPEEPTITPVVFVTPGVTPTEALLLYPTITQTIGVPQAAEGVPTNDPTINGCDIQGARITSPTAGETVFGQVVVEGEANVLKQVQYKFELRGGATGDAWIVVGTYPNETGVPSGYLGTWDSTSLTPGNYTLRMIILREDNTFPTPCEVPLVIGGSATGGGIPSP